MDTLFDTKKFRLIVGGLMLLMLITTPVEATVPEVDTEDEGIMVTVTLSPQVK
ncbi:MAG: hypothetical protein GY896_03655 [Gammaproteobacteria bacterium]|nr:hypothetical protein [Gammaproteobacteria bacterium]